MKKLGNFKLDNIYCGDCLNLMKDIPDNSIDLIVTDPPYGIAFMGKKWDTFEPKGAYQHKKGFKQLPRHSTNSMMEFFVPIWKECLRILKSGSFAFIMCSPRQDVLMTQIQALSEAGFNTGFTSIYWTYASGFPKASNISKIVDKRLGFDEVEYREPFGRENRSKGSNGSPFNGILKESPLGNGKLPYHIAISPQAKKFKGSYAGFQPKPAVEIIIVAMKPLSEKSYVDQALKNKKGITWLDDGRIPYESEKEVKSWKGASNPRGYKTEGDISSGGNFKKGFMSGASSKGRFPANLLVSDDILNDGKLFEGKNGFKHSATSIFGSKTKQNYYNKQSKSTFGSFSRYFDLDKWSVGKGVKDTFPFLIVPKASKSEKNKGLEDEDKMDIPFKERKLAVCKICGCKTLKIGSGKQFSCGHNAGIKWEEVKYKPRANFHPTVKPIKLMSYLIMLGSRKGDIILDPFIGSGTTAIACKILDRKYLGFEINKEYIEIAKARLAAIKHIQERLL